MSEGFEQDPEAARWHYRPSHPVALNPFFKWPLDLGAILRWYASYWLAASTTTLAVVLAVVIFYLFLPPLEAMGDVEIDWILRVWLANLVPHILCAGLLHFWLYKWRGQEKRFKYDPRDPAKDNGSFTFRNQVFDNMFWSLASGVTLWSFAQCLIYWSMANGYAPAFLFPEHPVWFFLMFPFLIVWASFHFYWIHRALHWPPSIGWRMPFITEISMLALGLGFQCIL